MSRLGYERVIIATPSPSGQVLRMDLGDGFVSQGDVDAGWQRVARPRRREGLEWVGQDARTLVTPVRFDRFLKGGRSIELECQAVEWGANVWFGQEQPPVYRLSGPIPWTNLQWVIGSVSWGEYLRRDSDGQRVRQDLSITWVEYEGLDVILTPAVRVAVAAAAAPATAGVPAPPPPGEQPRVYTVVSGDTLSKIAANELGDYKRWTEIASLNGLRDPNTITVGQRLKLP